MNKDDRTANDFYEDVLGHMGAAHMFASPSTREGFGITFVEAMAADYTGSATAGYCGG